MTTQIFKSYEDFKNRPDKAVNGVSEDFAAKFDNWQEMNDTNEGCWGCIDCHACKNMHFSKGCTFCKNGDDGNYYVDCHNWDIADKPIVDLQKW